MKSKILIFMLLSLTALLGKSQSVPNTTTFTLQDVYDVVSSHAPSTTGDLQSCFDNSVASYFDATYGSKTMTPQTLYGFRNYTVSCPSVGDSYEGGIVAYLFVSGDNGYIAGECHGIIASNSDLSSGAVWGCSGTDLTGASGMAIGTGNQNTTDIINGCSTSGIAARLCYDYVDGGYSDWFLPSNGELVKILFGLTDTGSTITDDTYYWSSSEYDATYSYSAKHRNLDDAVISGLDPKTVSCRVRAIRYF